MPRNTVAPHKTETASGPRYRVCIPQHLQAEHNQTRRFFTNRIDADKFADTLNRSRQGWTSRILALPDEIQGRLLRAFETCENDIEALEQVAAIVANRKKCEKKSLVDAIAEAVESKRVAKFSNDYCVKFRLIATTFAAGREHLNVAQVDTDMIHQYLQSGGWAGATQLSILSTLKALFSFCLEKKYCHENPCKAKRLIPKIEHAATCVFELADIEKLLRVAYEHDREMISYIALGTFAGIRPKELTRLHAEDIKPDCIVVERAKSKTSSRRSSKIHANLRSWLAIESRLNWKQPQPRIRKLCKIAGVTWGHDIMRHSFVSYTLPLYGATQTALWDGHSEKVLFKHYHAIRTSEQAQAFANLTAEAILKPAQENVIAMPASA